MRTISRVSEMKKNEVKLVPTRLTLIATSIWGFVYTLAVANTVSANPGRDTGISASKARVARAARLEASITIDGRLSEADWQRAPVQSGFWQQQPNEGTRPTFETEFRVLYDNNAVYVGVRAHDVSPKDIAKPLTRRDRDSLGDWIYIAFDSYFDRRTAFSFGLNAAGVQRDVLYYNDVSTDQGWNAVWEGASIVDSDGWTAEFRIPLSQLRFPKAEDPIWGLQVTRTVQRKNEISLWSPQPRDSGQKVSLFGQLTGLLNIAPQGRYELVPYASVGFARQNADTNDPLNSNADYPNTAGFDYKYGIGPNFTVSGAVNPDFGQVEADPSQVNLSNNEVFFDEKRPFFLEGADIFNATLQTRNEGSDTLFYSRRIGASPTALGKREAIYRNEPNFTTILGSVKLSGKTASGWSFGLVDAVTAEEKATIITKTGDRESPVIEPLTNYSVLRVQKDLHDGRTTVGGIVTGVHRSLAGTEFDSLHRSSYTGGTDLAHRFGNDDWSANFKVYGSHIRGKPEAIDSTQRASQRYYQRPDADYLKYDPTRTDLSGVNLSASVGKWSGGNWRYGLKSQTVSPGFAANDLGFLKAADLTRLSAWGQYWDAMPGDFVREWAADATVVGLWNYGGYQMDRTIELETRMTFLNYWNVTAELELERNFYSQRELRGGPLLARDPEVELSLGFSSDPRKPLVFSLETEGAVTWASNSSEVKIEPSVRWQARSNLDLTLGAVFGANHQDNQYVDQIDDTSRGISYLMGRINQYSASVTLRANYTLSTKLSIQLYAQPYLSAGRYNEFKEVTDSKAKEYMDRYRTIDRAGTERSTGQILLDRDMDGVTDLATNDPDFSFGQLRSTFVTRWEFRPGSTLFFIWNHNRTSFVNEGSLRLFNDLGDLANRAGEHLFLAKLSYWLGD